MLIIFIFSFIYFLIGDAAIKHMLQNKDADPYRFGKIDVYMLSFSL